MEEDKGHKSLIFIDEKTGEELKDFSEIDDPRHFQVGVRFGVHHFVTGWEYWVVRRIVQDRTVTVVVSK